MAHDIRGACGCLMGGNSKGIARVADGDSRMGIQTAQLFVGGKIGNYGAAVERGGQEEKKEAGKGGGNRVGGAAGQSLARI